MFWDVKMGESAPQLQILLNAAREDHMQRVKEQLRIKKIQKMVGTEAAPPWGPEEEAQLIKARKRHKALAQRVVSSFIEPWPVELGGES